MPEIVSGERRNTFVKCVFDSQGNHIGVVGLDVQLEIISDYIINTTMSQGSFGMLFSPDMTVFVHENLDFIGMKVYDPLFPPHTHYERIKNGEVINEGKMIDYKGGEAVGYFRPFNDGWYLGVVMPKNEYYQNLTYMGGIVTVMAVILGAILIGILISIDKRRIKSDEESRQKSMFLANMSHEIRTPINAIVGMTAIGRAAVNSDRKDYCFGKIDDASRHLLGVINDILDISKIEANKIELSPTEFNFERMLQHVVNVINYRVDEKNQQLTVFIDKSIPKIIIADEQRLAQVITNLLSNAVKFTPDKGDIDLRATYNGEQGTLCVIKIEVTDTGIGITPNQQAQLFEAFKQAESSTTRKYGGTGLGLSISKSITEMMGGKIWVESEVGKGSTFGFTVQAEHSNEAGTKTDYQFMNWGNIRILTVDDDTSILEYFSDIVSRFGTSCDVAVNAKEALSLIERKGSYNIYFVDLKMPDIDGIELTRQIRAREEKPGNAIVIMISSYDLNNFEKEAKAAGVNKFILKPLFPSSIADAINECIGIVNINNQEETGIDVNDIFSGRHILLAEDVEINREIVISQLEPTGVTIDCAENGLEAVEMFIKAPDKYDLIFMDVQMPEMDGYEATRQIRTLAHHRSETVPIVAMTANVFKEDVKKCIESGMNGHIGKPIDFTDLINEAKKYLF